MTDAALRKLQRTSCDVRADRLTRILFATDASIYQMEPQAAAFPRSAREASAIICAGIDAGLSITPRGAGTSLVGNAIGDGLIVDFSRHNRGISGFDLEKGRVRVGAGVVLDQLNAFLSAPQNLNEILAGSEGTLAAIFSAELKISRLPREKGLGLIFFASVADAMQATVALLDLKPAAIEHIDRPLLDQTRGQLHFQAARDLMELDTNPCAAVLIVEFYDENVAERLAILQARQLGLRSKILTNAREMDLVWSVRKAGLSLLTGCVGAKKPVAFIEDAAVRPAQLPEYVRGLEGIMRPLGLEASYYGHAASGLLHVRPVLDLHSAEDLKKFRQVANQTSALVKQFKGSLSAEHGVSIARTEYMHEQLGDELLGAMREIKRIFDPRDRMNPV